MRDGWAERSLQSVTLKIGSGATPRGGKDVYTDHGIAFIRSQNVYDNTFSHEGLARIDDQAAAHLDSVAVQQGDVLICITGESVTRTCMVDPSALPARVSQHVAIARPNPSEVDSRFLLAALLNPGTKSLLNKLSEAGATRRALTKGHLEALRIALPPLPEQRAIAGVLGALDDLIDTNTASSGRLRAQITALYREAVSADPHRLPLTSAFEVEFGGAYKGTAFTEPGVGMPLLRIRDLKTFNSDVWTTERLGKDVLVEPGDVLVGMDAEFRPTFWLGEPSLMNQRVCRITSRNASLALVREALVAPLAFIEGHKTGTTVAHLNKSDLEEAKVILPSGDRLGQFDLQADPLRVALVGLTQENQQLRRTRDELLPLLMSGAVAVSEVVSGVVL